ncbi:TPA: hypothetical protein ACKOGW_003513, partial [Clostridioides difficile]
MINISSNIGLCIYIFIYFITIFLIPVFFRNNNLSFAKSILFTLVIIIISLISIFYLDGLGKSLYRYCVLLLIVGVDIIITFMKNRI